MICVTWEETTGALRQIFVSEKKREIVIASLKLHNKAVKEAYRTHAHVFASICNHKSLLKHLHMTQKYCIMQNNKWMHILTSQKLLKGNEQEITLHLKKIRMDEKESKGVCMYTCLYIIWIYERERLSQKILKYEMEEVRIIYMKNKNVGSWCSKS